MTNLVVFDLDHTLLAGDSNKIWTDFLYDKGVLDAAFMQRRNQIIRAYQQGNIDFATDLACMLAPLAMLPRQRLETLRTQCFTQQVAPKLYAYGITLLEQYKYAGDVVLIISATNEFLLAPLLDVLSVDGIIGVQLARNSDGDFTGGYTGTPSFGAGKLARLNTWLTAHQLRLDGFADSYFYSDSINDAPLLQAVTQPRVVHPDARLRQLATQQGWPVSSFADASKPAPH